MSDLNSDHRKVLEYLNAHTAPDGERCSHFAPIVRETSFPLNKVRRICRALKRRGMAEFYNGLWTEDGEPAGAGYCISKAREAALNPETVTQSPTPRDKMVNGQ